MVGARPIRTAPICARARRADLRSRGRPQRPQSTASLPLHMPSPLAGSVAFVSNYEASGPFVGACSRRAHPNFPGPASSWAGLFCATHAGTILGAPNCLAAEATLPRSKIRVERRNLAPSAAGPFLWSGASVLRSADSGCKRSTLNSARSRHSTGLPRVLARPARSATGLPVIANALTTAR
jgi:hypothetical protein